MQHTSIITTVAAAFAVTVMTVGCSPEKGSTADGIDFESFKTEKRAPLTQQPGAPECAVSLNVLEARSGNAAVDKAVNNAIADELFGMTGQSLKAVADSFATQYADDYKKNLTAFYREDQNDKSRRKWYEYTYKVTTSTEKARDGFTVYKAVTDYYEGGAHGVSITAVMNFSNATGKRYRLKDVFVPGSEKRLADLLLSALEEKTGQKGIDALKEAGYLNTTDIYAPQNFALGPDGVTFVYNAYEIAPYEKGITELTLSYDDLKDLLVKELQ